MLTEHSALRREDRLRARLSAFDRLLGRTHEMIQDALDLMERPYVALSGGKDSAVVLDLVAQHRPEITAIWVDDELEYPEQPAYIPALCRHTGAALIVKTGTQYHAEWFQSWADEPFWREPLPGTIITRESLRTLAPSFGFDGVFLGLRGQERAHRRVHLASHGPLYETVHGIWQCNPLAWWDVADVWAYIAANGLPYNPVYDRLASIGVPRDKQRVGPLPLSEGWMLQRGWPDLYDRLVTRYGRRW